MFETDCLRVLRQMWKIIEEVNVSRIIEEDYWESISRTIIGKVKSKYLCVHFGRYIANKPYDNENTFIEIMNKSVLFRIMYMYLKQTCCLKYLTTTILPILIIFMLILCLCVHLYLLRFKEWKVIVLRFFHQHWEISLAS